MLVSPKSSFSFIIGEDPLWSREPISVLYNSGPSLAAGTVLAKTSVAAYKTAHATPSMQNIGMSGLVFDDVVPVAASTLDGIYNLVITESGPTAAFNLVDETGSVVGSGNVGTQFIGAFNFTLTAVSGAMVSGDQWRIKVSSQSSTISISPAPTNVGIGVVSMNTKEQVLPGAILGTYKIVLTATGSTAPFNLVDPTGTIIASGNVGTAFTGGPINFVLTAAGTMTSGDTWNVAISQLYPAYLWNVVNPLFPNAWKTATGILLNAITANSAAQAAMALTRGAKVDLSSLIWPSGFTASQIAAGVSQLAAAGIIAV